MNVNVIDNLSTLFSTVPDAGFDVFLAEIKETTDKDLNEDGNIPDDLWNEDFKETNTTKHPLSNWATDIKTVKVGTPDSYIEKRADSAVYDEGETIHYTIVAEQTTKDGKLTNAVVEDKESVCVLPARREIGRAHV